MPKAQVRIPNAKEVMAKTGFVPQMELSIAETYSPAASASRPSRTVFRVTLSG
jgi:hypothetical protein